MADEVTGKGEGGGFTSRYMDQFSAFRTGMDRLFESFLSGVPALASLRQSFPAALALTPVWDVKETEKDLIVKWRTRWGNEVQG
jgi:HSP20 family protein